MNIAAKAIKLMKGRYNCKAGNIIAAVARIFENAVLKYGMMCMIYSWKNFRIILIYLNHMATITGSTWKGS